MAPDHSKNAAVRLSTDDHYQVPESVAPLTG